jgi:hypothetical protein
MVGELETPFLGGSEVQMADICMLSEDQASLSMTSWSGDRQRRWSWREADVDRDLGSWVDLSMMGPQFW